MNPPLVFVTHEFAPFRGGVATYAEELAQALSLDGADVSILTLGFAHPEEDMRFPFEVVRLGGKIGLKPGSMLALSRGLWRHCKRLHVSHTVLMSHGALVCGQALRMSGLLKAGRYSIILHGSELLKIQFSPLKRLLARMLVRGARFVAGTSDNTRVAAESSFLGSCIRKAVTLPCAVPEWLKEGAGRVERASSPVRVLTMARIHPRKGQLDVARALSQMPDSLKRNFVYVLGGTGDKDYLSQVLRVAEVGGVNVEILGEIARADLHKLYSSCHLYVMTSRSIANSVEGFGITYLEAGYFGLPVVANNTGGVPEAVLQEKTGLLVQEGDINGLTLALRRLIENSQLRAEMGCAGSAHAMSFSWRRTAGMLQDLVKEPEA